MPQFSEPAQAGATAAATINSARKTWMHLAPADFIAADYRIFRGQLSSRKLRTENQEALDFLEILISCEPVGAASCRDDIVSGSPSPIS
jgi:hypothetical protein